MPNVACSYQSLLFHDCLISFKAKWIAVPMSSGNQLHSLHNAQLNNIHNDATSSETIYARRSLGKES